MKNILTSILSITAVSTLLFSGVNAEARNGKLQINLAGEDVKVSRIVVTDITGKRISDEGNSVTATLPQETKLVKGVPVQVSVDAPKGTFSKGCTVKVFDAKGNAVAFCTVADGSVKIKGGKTVSIKFDDINGLAWEPAEVLARGYYKDMLIDCGVTLTKRPNLPAADLLGWEYDIVSTQNDTIQNRIMVTSDIDINGCLLYPDNEPRYRMMYVHGGLAAAHGSSLTAVGRKHVGTFVDNGGSYVGSCAGALLAGVGTYTKPVVVNYFRLFPAVTIFTNLKKAYTPLTIPDDSPLLKYYDFGGDHLVDSVRHNGGNYCSDSLMATVPGAEVLARFVAPGKPYDKQACIWAYKANEVKGRVVPCGSHPEAVEEGERLEMMAAMCQYAVDGNGIIQVKGELKNGEERVMDQLTSANKPENTGIGDRQYHHYKLVVPDGGARKVKISLKADSRYDLTLSLRKGDFAWRTDAPYVLAQKGANKTLTIDSLEAGEWYVSVYCATAGTTTFKKNVFNYNGDTSVLNGVPYILEASWK